MVKKKKKSLIYFISLLKENMSPIYYDLHFHVEIIPKLHCVILWKHNTSCESYLCDISNDFKVHLLPSPSCFLWHTHTHMSTPSSLSLVNLVALAVKAAGICYFALFGIAASSHLIQTVSLGSLWHTGAEVAKELSQRCPHKGFLLQTSGVW